MGTSGPKPGTIKAPAIDRFLLKIAQQVNGCWLWIGHVRKDDGYATFYFDGKRAGYAHIFAYEYFVGDVPDGLTLDHLCHTRHCVNPTHVEPVTFAENVRRGLSFAGINYGKIACSQGHLLEGDNLRMEGRSRRCRTCAKSASQRFRERRAS